MASQVEVRGGGDFDGAILQNAATEATLQRLVAAFEGRTPGSGGKVSELFGNMRTNTRALQESTQEIRTSTQETGKFSSAIKQAAGSLSTLVSAGLQTAFSFLDRGLNVFRETSAVGASFNNSIFELAASAAESNMSMEEFSALVQKNSTLFSLFGGTVTQGAKAFGKLSEAFRQELGEQFYGMGLTVRDLNDYLAAYLEIEMRSGRLRSRNEKEIRANAAAYIMELDKAAKLLGVSRKAQEAAMNKSAVDPMFRAMQRNLTDEQRAMATSTIAMLDQLSPALTEAVKDAGFFAKTDQGKAVLAAIGRENVQKLLRGDKDSQKILVLLAERLDQLQKSYPELAAGSGGVVGSFFELFGYASPLLKDFITNTEEALEEQKKREFVTTQLAKASDAFNRIKNSLIAAFLRSELFGKFLTGLEKVSNWISRNADSIIRGLAAFFKPMTDWFSKTFGDFMKTADEQGYQKAFENLFPNIFEGIKSILISTFETISDFLIYLWTGEMPDRLLSKMNNMSSSFMQGFQDPRARREGDVAGGGRLTKDSFKFSGISGMFQGLFDGFSLGSGGGGFFESISNFFKGLKLPDISGFFDNLKKRIQELKETVAAPDVEGKSIFDWFTEFKDLFLKIPDVLTVAEAKVSSMIQQFQSMSEGAGGSAIANIRDIVDGLNRLTEWYDNFDVMKFGLLAGMISSFTSGASSGGDGEPTFIQKIDKTIELIDRLENFKTGPIKELNTQYSAALQTTRDFIGLKDEAIGFVDGLAASVDKLTKELEDLKKSVPTLTEFLYEKSGAKGAVEYFTGDDTSPSTTTPSNEPGWMEWLGNKFDEMIGENKEQTRQLKNIARER